MPKVTKTYPYTDKGMKAAKADAKKIGGKMSMGKKKMAKKKYTKKMMKGNSSY